MSTHSEFLINGNSYFVEITSLGEELTMSVNGQHYAIKGASGFEREIAALEINGTSYAMKATNLTDFVHVQINSNTYRVEKKENKGPLNKEKLSGNNITASMPGIIIEATCKENDNVKQGDIILSTESMKMQTNIAAPRDGVIEKIHFQKNETFEKGAILVSLKEV